MQGIAKFLSKSSDPLAALNDAFSGSSLDPKWSIYKPAATPGITVSGGFCRTPIVEGGTPPAPTATDSFWFNANNGILLYQLCSGNFDARVYAEARDVGDSGPCTTSDFKIVGLAAHDPVNPPFNYVHVGLGSNDTASLQAENKSTENSVSVFNYLPNASGAAWIRLLRIGQVFTTMFGPTSSGPWTTLAVVNRSVALPPLPTTVRLGLMTYSNDTSPGGGVLGRFSNFTVLTPAA